MYARMLFLVLVILTLLGAQAGWAATVNLAWDANTESDLDGYKLYYGTTQGAYPNVVVIDDKSATTWQLTLVPGTYYFAMTAFDTSGNESGFSDEVDAVIPGVEPPGKPGKPTLVQ